MPGVITPVPPEKLPVKLALSPAVTDVGFAAKLEIVAGAEGEEPPQLVIPTLRAMPEERAAIHSTNFRLAMCCDWCGELPALPGFLLIDINLSITLDLPDLLLRRHFDVVNVGQSYNQIC